MELGQSHTSSENVSLSIFRLHITYITSGMFKKWQISVCFYIKPCYKCKVNLKSPFFFQHGFFLTNWIIMHALKHFTKEFRVVVTGFRTDMNFRRFYLRKLTNHSTWKKRITYFSHSQSTLWNIISSNINTVFQWTR